MPIVTLTTDFGTRDSYVSEMKAAVIDRCPNVRLVDVTHEVEPGDVEGGAWVLGRIWERYPPATVHLCVVDPGVGGTRLPIAVLCRERWLVGPDNGLLTRVLFNGPPTGAWRLDPAAVGVRKVADTFHGRDLFAPAAGRIACGEAASALGATLDLASVHRLVLPLPRRQADRLEGRVAHVDRFGNLVTDIPTEWLPPHPSACVAGRAIEGIATAYASVPAGGLVLTRGSGGTLEISVHSGSAAEVLGVGRGGRVEVRDAAEEP